MIRWFRSRADSHGATKVDAMLDLTKQYSALFGKQGAHRVMLFARDVYRSGKASELGSFILWELRHQLRLFPRSAYIRFSRHEALSLTDEVLRGDHFHAKVVAFFGARDLRADRCPHDWKLLFLDERKQIFGCCYPDDCDLYLSTDSGESRTFLYRFPERIKAIFVSTRGTVFVCIKGAVYKSTDNGRSFEQSLELASPESFFRFNNAMTETPDGRLVIGEYGNVWDKNRWRSIAYLYFSADEGATWQKSDYLLRKGTNKHVHVVKYSRVLDRLLVADGDNYKKLWISGPMNALDSGNPQFRAVNRFHFQMGGYTSAVEDDGALVFGTDYQGGTNFIVTTADGARYGRRIMPDPYRRSPIDNMVLRKAKNGTEIWANLPFSTAGTKALLMYTNNGGDTWNKVLEYDSAAYKVWLLNSSVQMPGKLYLSVEDVRNRARVGYGITDM